jgi:hypothetical protein
MPNKVGGALTRKIGPLPAWGWGVAVGGAVIAAKLLGGGGDKKAAPPQIVQTEYDDSFGPTVGFQEGLSNQLFDLQQRIDDLSNIAVTPTPTTTTAPPKPAPVVTVPKAPVVAKTATSALTRARAAVLARAKGIDPARLFGWGRTVPMSAWWVNKPQQKYIWKNEATFNAWLDRVAADRASAKS